MHLCKEGVDQNRFKILYVPTHRMIADGCTKAWENKNEFEVFMNALFNGIVFEKKDNRRALVILQLW